MKHSTFFTIAIAMFVALIFTSCDKDNDNDNDFSKVQSLSGTWKTISPDEYYLIYRFKPESTGKGTVRITPSPAFDDDPFDYDYTIDSNGRLSIIFNLEHGEDGIESFDITSISATKMTWFFRPSVISSSTEHYIYLEKIGN